MTAGDNRLDLKVGPDTLTRAAWIMDGFIKRFEEAGFHVLVKDGSTLVELAGQTVAVRMRELLKRHEAPPEQRKYSWHEYRYVPNGVLVFELIGAYGSDRRISDTSRAPLEQKIDRIVDALRQRLEEEIRRAERQRIEQIFKRYEALGDLRRERRRAELKQRAECLMLDVDAWRQSKRVRAYLGAFRTTVEKWSGPIDPTSEVGKWFRWASSYAESLDPLNPTGEVE
jgi:hypothetical protein